MLIPVFFFGRFLRMPTKKFGWAIGEGWSFIREQNITSLFVVTFRKVDFVFTPLSIYLSKHEHLGFRKGWDLSLLEKPTGYWRVVCLGWKVSISVGESVRNHRTEMDLKDAMTLKLFAVLLGHWKWLVFWGWVVYGVATKKNGMNRKDLCKCVVVLNSSSEEHIDLIFFWEFGAAWDSWNQFDHDNLNNWGFGSWNTFLFDWKDMFVSMSWVSQKPFSCDHGSVEDFLNLNGNDHLGKSHFPLKLLIVRGRVIWDTTKYS